MKKVYKAISNVMLELSKEGIAKDKKNLQQGYAFRGIDDMYNALAAILPKNNLVVLPKVLRRSMVEKQTKSGGTLFYTTVKVEFTLISTEDDSSHVVVMYGEAMDSGDKSTNKAMSAALKYAYIQTFCIPTEGDNDADAHTPTVDNTAIKTPTPKVATPTAKAPAEAKPEMSDAEAVIGATYLCILDGIRNKDAITVQEAYKQLDEEMKKKVWGKLSVKEKTEARILLAKKLEEAE